MSKELDTRFFDQLTMPRTFLPIVAIMFAPAIASAQGIGAAQELRALDSSSSAIGKRQPFDYSAYVRSAERARTRVWELIAHDSLRTADEFVLASRLAGDPSGFYENRRVEHELALVALAMGHPDAMKRVAMTWDALNWSIGRGQRFGSFKQRDGTPTNMDPVPAPASLLAVVNDLATARAKAGGAKDLPELQKIRDADQADRQEPLDQSKIESMKVNDPLRRQRVLELIAGSALVTGRDFHNAALVLQHGTGFEDFRLAHELSIAAVALGDSTAAWLVSRTYDRMLLTLGHRQRFATQSRETGPSPTDSTALNDRIRSALGAAVSRTPAP